MQDQYKIDWFRAKFADANIEKAFGQYAFKRYLTSNLVGIGIILALNTAYIPFDFVDTQNPIQVVTLKIAVLTMSVGLLMSLRVKSIQPHFNLITTLIVIMLSSTINMIILWQPDLNNTYYIGLIQGLITFSLLLRLEFTSWLVLVTINQIGFMAAAFSKPDSSAAMLQSSNVLVVALICVAGVNLLQRYQRADFVKNRIIEEQNAKLSEMLADVQKDNERKIAALGMLVHFVRTPIHQISGFTDVVMSQLGAVKSPQDAGDCLESAQYIKTASSELVSNVTRLLDYHKLDDIERSAVAENASISDMVLDACEEIRHYDKVAMADSQCVISTYREPLQAALKAIIDNINDHAGDATYYNVRAERVDDGCLITIAEDGPGLEEAEFEELAKPLTEISDHLNTTGARMPMGLRTANRAIDICGGVMSYAKSPTENQITIFLPDLGDVENGSADSEQTPHLRLVS